MSGTAAALSLPVSARVKIRWGRLALWGGGAVLALVFLYLALIGALTLDARAGPSTGIDARFMDAAALLVGTSLAPGHRVHIMTSGDQVFQALWADLRRARRSLNVQMFYVGPGAVLDSVSAILAERARAGVRTRFLYDAFGGDVPDEVRAGLRAAGVAIAVFRPIRWYAAHKSHNRSHARAVIVDGTVGYVGGFGFDDRWLGDGRTGDGWRESTVRFEGPAVAQLQAAFATAWAEATGELLVDELPQRPAAPAAGAVAGVLHARPTVGSTAGDRLFALSAAAARRRLYLSNAYFVPSDSHLRLLTQAARRGVDVRILVPGPRIDLPITRRAGRGFYERLLAGGVRIFEYQPVMMHAKTFTVDGLWASVGSMNFDELSLSHNDEVNLLLYDAALASRLDSIFLADLPYSREIVLSEFRERPWHERVRERLAAVVRDFL
jgi:cardiolipin synthase